MSVDSFRSRFGVALASFLDSFVVLLLLRLKLVSRLLWARLRLLWALFRVCSGFIFELFQSLAGFVSRIISGNFVSFFFSCSSFVLEYTRSALASLEIGLASFRDDLEVALFFRVVSGVGRTLFQNYFWVCFGFIWGELAIAR